jgi:hypothetical protein
MVTKVLSDTIKPRSEKEWQSVALFASGAKVKSTHEAVTGSAVEIGDWDKICIVHDITAVAAADVGDTYDVYIDMSMDNLAWYNVGHFTQALGNGAVSREQMIFVAGPYRYAADPNATLIASADLAATVVSNHLRGRYIRYRIAIVDDAANASWTSSLTAAVMSNDDVRQAENEIKEVELYSLAIRTNETVVSPSAIWEIGDSWEWMQVVVRITNCDTDAGDKLDVFIDLSMDGTRWVNVGAITQQDGDGAANVECMVFTPGLADNVDATVVVTADCAETVLRPGFAGAFLRARAVITESGTDDETFTFGVKAYIQ